MPGGEKSAPMDMPEPIPSGGPEIDEPQGMAQDFNPDEEELEVDKEDAKSDSEIDNIFSKLDTEKQAAVIKYAKSMVDDNEVEDGSKEDNNAPMENESDDEIVTEITNNILDDMQKPEDRQDEKIRNKKITHSNPFITKNFAKK